MAIVDIESEKGQKVNHKLMTKHLGNYSYSGYSNKIE